MQGGGDGESNSCRGHAESTDIYTGTALNCIRVCRYDSACLLLVKCEA